jgi:hypothetical protein
MKKLYYSLGKNRNTEKFSSITSDPQRVMALFSVKAYPSAD